MMDMLVLTQQLVETCRQSGATCTQGIRALRAAIQLMPDDMDPNDGRSGYETPPRVERECLLNHS